MKKILLFLILTITIKSYSQSYTEINAVAIKQNNYSINNNLGLYSIASSLNSFRNSWEDENSKKRAIQKYEAQLNLVKKIYSDKKSLPGSIVNGWHLVKVTDNFNYCSDAKVLVKDNKIQRFIISNYSEYSLNFNSIGSINKGKCYLNLELPNGHKDAVEVYFLYDLDSSNIVDNPIEPGYISFWSDLRKARTIEIWINETRQGQLKKRVKKESVNCFDNGTFSLKLKPGTYNYRAEANGALGWRGKITIKEGECFTLLLNRDNKD